MLAVASLLLLASVGVRSGHTFKEIILEGEAGTLLIAGTLVSLISAFCVILIGFKLFRIPFSILSGMVSNQPAVVDFATEQSGNQLPGVGFALMFPIAMIMKIVFAQMLFVFLS